MDATTSDNHTALRLGWTVAEVRGRNWPQGPRPSAPARQLRPKDVLPLRYQRAASASKHESAAALVTLARSLAITGVDDLEAQLVEVLPYLRPGGGSGDSSDSGEAGDDHPDRTGWKETAAFFLTWDGRIQDDLTQRGEAMANAYLLGRGIAESYWGLGPERAWVADGEATAVSPAYLFGSDRRRELTRMLGRLDPGLIHPVSGAAISGTLEAWAEVAHDERWTRAPDFRDRLYEQARRWYQLLVLGQDPTTMIRPYASIGGLRTFARSLRLFWPQALLALVAIGLLTAFLTVTGGPSPEWLTSLLATSGFSAIVAAGLLTKGQSAAQKLVTRLRQDAYTDLVAVSVTTLPAFPEDDPRRSGRETEKRLESAVRRRLLTPATAAPPG